MPPKPTKSGPPNQGGGSNGMDIAMATASCRALTDEKVIFWKN